MGAEARTADGVLRTDGDSLAQYASLLAMAGGGCSSCLCPFLLVKRKAKGPLLSVVVVVDDDLYRQIICSLHAAKSHHFRPILDHPGLSWAILVMSASGWRRASLAWSTPATKHLGW